MGNFGAKRGLLVSWGGFTKVARQASIGIIVQPDRGHQAAPLDVAGELPGDVLGVAVSALEVDVTPARTRSSPDRCSGPAAPISWISAKTAAVRRSYLASGRAGRSLLHQLVSRGGDTGRPCHLEQSTTLPGGRRVACGLPGQH
jgi:hypothetical protein